jgi:hypothetical protein
MTADDAAALTETARDLMLATLKEISAPPPKRAIADTPEMKSPQTVASTDDESAKSDSLVVKSIESLRSKTSTEDEMDDDAVVLKHPN